MEKESVEAAIEGAAADQTADKATAAVAAAKEAAAAAVAAAAAACQAAEKAEAAAAAEAVAANAGAAADTSRAAKLERKYWLLTCGRCESGDTRYFEFLTGTEEETNVNQVFCCQLFPALNPTLLKKPEQ